jgi:ribonuclease E
MEAAEEVARQLRLRDLGGLIVIDFIDMRENRHNIEVEKTLKNALKMDKARVNVGRISQFGIMEMSRQRIAKTLNDAIHLECPHCEGRGKVKSVEAMAVSFLRKVHAAAAKGTIAEVRGGLPLEVAYYLLNRKKRELTQIENDYEIEVTVKGKTSFLLNQLELETVKREKPHLEDVLMSEAEAEEAHKPGVPAVTLQQAASDDEQKIETGTQAEGGKKRKRRKKKKKTTGEPLLNTNVTNTTDTETEQTNDSDAEAESDGDETAVIASADTTETDPDQTPAKPKKRKRKRSRSSGDALLEATGIELTAASIESIGETFPAVASDTNDVAISDEESSAADETMKPKKRKRKRSRKSGDAHHEAAVPEVPAEQDSEPTEAQIAPTDDVPVSVEEENIDDMPVKSGRKKRKRIRSKIHKDVEPIAEEVTAVMFLEPQTLEISPSEPASQETPAPEAKPKRARAPRKKNETAVVETPVTPEPPVEAAAVPESLPAIKKPRKNTVKNTASSNVNESLPLAIENDAAPEAAVKRKTAPKRTKKSPVSQ